MEDRRKQFIEQLIEQLPHLRNYMSGFKSIGIDIDDVQQEVLLRALLCENFTIDNVAAWAKRVIRNICLNYYSSQLYYEQYCNTVLNEDSAEYAANRHDSLCEYDRAVVRKQITQLSSKDSIVVELYMQGLSYNEICKKLSLTMPAVKNRILRAKKLLRKSLGEME